MKTLICLLLLVSPLAVAQRAHVHGGQPGVAYQTPDTNMPAGKIYIDTTTIPHKKAGAKVPLVVTSCGPLVGTDPAAECSPSAYPSGEVGYGWFGGAFRLKCNISHWSFDDPIVKPGQAGMTHLHQFFGNTTTDSQSDAGAMKDVGDSTCGGGTVNNTGYWVPVLVYHCPALEVGCNRARDGEVYPAIQNNAYYKSENFLLRWSEAGGVGANATEAVSQQRALRWWPVGFRMIAGDPNNVQPENVQGTFDCFWSGAQTTGYKFNHLPNSAEAAAANTGNGCTEINMIVYFPSCRADDESILYLATPVGGVASGHVDGPNGQLGSYRGCHTPGFSIPTPELTYNIHTRVPNNADWDYMVLSSDQPVHASVVQAGSTTTQIHLAASEYSTSTTYPSGAIMWNGERRYITAYNGTTKVATVSPAFATAPPAGATVGVRTPGGLSAHGDWANGWSTRTDIPGLGGHTITDQIIRGCYVDEVRYGTMPTSKHLNCHDNILGDPSASTNAWPRIGGTSSYLDMP